MIGPDEVAQKNHPPLDPQIIDSFGEKFVDGAAHKQLFLSDNATREVQELAGGGPK